MWASTVMQFVLSGKCTYSAGHAEMLSIRTNVSIKTGSGWIIIDHSVTDVFSWHIWWFLTTDSLHDLGPFTTALSFLIWKGVDDKRDKDMMGKEDNMDQPHRDGGKWTPANFFGTLREYKAVLAVLVLDRYHMIQVSSYLLILLENIAGKLSTRWKSI